MDVVTTVVEYHTKLSVKLEWVKGHQDVSQSLQNSQPSDGLEESSILSLAAQLNIEADRLASSAAPGHTGSAILYGSDEATLIIDGISYHGYYDKALRRSLTVPLLKEYYKKKFGITAIQFQNIDWRSHSMALNHFYESQRTIIKWLYRWMPTNVYQNRNNSDISPLCPSCSQTQEDQFHLLHCPDTRRTWFPKFKNQIQVISKRCHVSAPLINLLLAAWDLLVYQCPIPKPAIDSSVQQVYDRLSGYWMGSASVWSL